MLYTNHRFLILGLCVFSPAFLLAASLPLLTVKPDCKPVNAPKVGWSVAFCEHPERNHHYPTEIKFSRQGKEFFGHVLLAGPTGGIFIGELLAASERFAMFQLPADESNRIMVFDLEKKAVTFNTGQVVGMGSCKVNSLSDQKSDFCRLSFTCVISDYETNFSEFLCG